MIGNDWDLILKDEFEKKYFLNLMYFINKEYENKRIYPKKEDIFNSLKITKYKDVSVVIIGQDPYHNEDEAHGLAFSVKEGKKIPPSLKNIFKKINLEFGIKEYSTDLTKWANQGVLLLNSILTVEENKPLSHRKIGWEIFTDKIIQIIGEKDSPVVFILMGNQAKEKEQLIKNKNHLVIKTVHPSPLSASRGFFEEEIFKKTNDFLIKNNKNKINW